MSDALTSWLEANGAPEPYGHDGRPWHVDERFKARQSVVRWSDGACRSAISNGLWFAQFEGVPVVVLLRRTASVVEVEIVAAKNETAERAHEALESEY